MIRKLVFGSALGCVLLLSGSHVARSQEATPVTGPPPQGVVVSEPSASVRMMTDDATRTMEWLREQHRLSTLIRFPSIGRIDLLTLKADPESDGAGVSRTIRVGSAPVVNPTPLFLFSDVTARSAQPAAPRRQIPLKQRVATVEAYRQSLTRGK